MGTLRFADLQTQSTKLLELTSLSMDEFRQSVPPFATAFQAHMAARWTTAHHPSVHHLPGLPLPTPEDRLLLILLSLKTYPLQVVEEPLFGLGQSQAHHSGFTSC
jgi:hypothetical protein